MFAASSTRKSYRLQLESLEGRETPAVTATFDTITDTLHVRINNQLATAQDVAIGEIGGLVSINGDTDSIRINGVEGSLSATEIKFLKVTGSKFDNEIDLTDVTRASFGALDDRVTVNAQNGNDLVWGSEFEEEQHGGKGNDELHGADSHDRLIGDEGNDELFGEDGDDELYGKQGIDFFDGGNGDRDVAHNWVPGEVTVAIEFIKKKK